DDVAGVERFCNTLERFLMTVSWGGYEALMFPVCVVHPTDAPLHAGGALPLSLVRLSIGLEEPDVLIADLERALAAVLRAPPHFARNLLDGRPHPSIFRCSTAKVRARFLRVRHWDDRSMSDPRANRRYHWGKLVASRQRRSGRASATFREPDSWTCCDSSRA